MRQKICDVFLIGGGNAGFGVRIPTRAAGMKVVLAEARDLGGTCPNRGCTSKKVLVAAGRTLQEIGRAYVHGIKVGNPTLDWAPLITGKSRIKGIPDRLAKTLAGPGVEVLHHHARFADPNDIKSKL